MARRVEQRISNVLNFFSVGLLLRTLFDPFRQIAAGQDYGPSLDAHMKAWADRTFSRAVGFVMRSIFIVLGITATVFTMLIGIVELLLWPCIPILPLLGVIGFVMGWTL